MRLFKYRVYFFLLAAFSLTLLGCVKVPLPEEVQIKKDITTPPVTYGLEDDSGNVLGFATPINKHILVAPDHLRQSEETLYFQNKAIEILARDFRHDLLFFKVEDLTFESVPVWSNKPPGAGQRLSWDSSEAKNEATVFSTRSSFDLGSTVIEDTMEIKVIVLPGDSGKPLYDPVSHTIYGMLIATDALKGVSHFIRSDEVLTLAKEYLNTLY